MSPRRDATPLKRSGLTFSFPEMDGESRLRELVLYISGKCLTDPNFGRTKLHKILHFADFASYEQRGIPITGVEYMKLPRGPVAKPLKLILSDMEEREEIFTYKEKIIDHDQYRTIPRREANLDLFRPQDIAILDAVIERLWGRTAIEVSELSHGVAWSVAEEMDLIPYEAALLSDDSLPEDAISVAEELVREYGLDA